MPVSLASTGAATTHGAVVPIAYATPSSQGVVFNNIPTTYQDLYIVMFVRSNVAATNDPVVCYFKESTYGYSTSSYSTTRLTGNGSTATSTRNTSRANIDSDSIGASGTSGVYSAQTWHILNYANTSTFKTVLIRTASDLNGSGLTTLEVGLWRVTDSITQIGFYTNGSSTPFVAGSTIALYGIRSVNQ